MIEKVSKILNTIFHVSFYFYIFFLIIDLIKPGFVVNFFYLNFILIFLILLLIIDIFLQYFYKKIYQPKHIWFKIIMILIIGFLLSIILLNKMGENQTYLFFLPITASIAIILSSLLFLDFKQKS
jgi:hypothetical protein